MKNINLYGNVVRDLIFNACDIAQNHSNTAGHFSERLGGIVNILRGIRAQSNIQVNVFSSFSSGVEDELKDFQNVRIVYNNSPTAVASVLESENSKTSVVFWGKQIIPFKPMVGWNHISYLDRIDNIDECLKLKEINSADLCLGKYTRQQKNRLFNILRHINYLIISDHELSGLTRGKLEPLIGLVKKGVVVHSKKGCVFADKNHRYAFKTKRFLKNSKIVGAGDIFASVFILSSLKKFDIVGILKKCNNNTPVLLKQINKYE